MKQVIKSVLNSDKEVLKAISDMFLGGDNYHLDPCFSSGTFYEGELLPEIKMDKEPKSDDVIQNDILNGIPLENNSIKSIVFDPPFMFGTHGQTKNNIMNKRFTMFDSWQELEQMYKKSLQEFYRIIKKNGIVAFKCQDYTDSKTTLTHCFVHNWAMEQGFRIEDLFIMYFKGGRIWNSNLIQRHARKYHSYWIVLRK